METGIVRLSRPTGSGARGWGEPGISPPLGWTRRRSHSGSSRWRWRSKWRRRRGQTRSFKWGHVGETFLFCHCCLAQEPGMVALVEIRFVSRFQLLSILFHVCF